MRTLDRKLLRELGQIKAQALAIALVVASGIGAFVAMASTWASLERTRADYYAKSRFGDVFATLKRAPLPVADAIAALPDVQEVEARVLAVVDVDVEGFAEPVRGTILSLPDGGRPRLNDLHLRRGRWPAPERSAEVLVHEAFAEAHGLEPGDGVEALINGRLQRLEIVGVVLSAEFVYQVTPGTIFPDDARNGVFWMNERALARAYDMEGAFNDVVVRLARGARPEPTIAAIDRLLQPWGGVGAVSRADQGSDRMLTEELRGLQSQAVIIPAIFLGVAAFLLQLVLGRIVAGQREVIAVLKALGYRTRTVGLHYLKLVAIVCLAGGALGGIAGVVLGRLLVSVYQPFFRFPDLRFHLQGGVLLGGLAIAVGAGVIATVGSVRRVVRLPPAEAMKPPAPATFRPMLLERLGLAGHLPPAARMVLRRIARTPIKSALSSLGVALSLGILLASYGLMGAIDVAMDLAFRQEQRQDVAVAFVEPQDEGILHEVRRLPGVLWAEPVRSVPVRLRAGHLREDLALQGLPADGALRRVLGLGGRQVGLPPDGLVLSRELGRQLRVREGDTVTVEVLEAKRPTVPMRVAALVDDLLGLNAYVELEPLYRMLGEGRRISGANVQLDANAAGAFLAAIEERPVIAGAQLRAAALQSFEETSAASQNVTTTLLAFFASVIAVGVVYNTARILLADSSRELASLRVLGFTRREISRLFLGELAALVAAALPLGWLLGWLLAQLISATMPADLYRLPIRIPPADLLRSVAIVLAAAGLSALLVRRRLDRLDLIAVLKTRE